MSAVRRAVESKRAVRANEWRERAVRANELAAVRTTQYSTRRFQSHSTQRGTDAQISPVQIKGGGGGYQKKAQLNKKLTYIFTSFPVIALTLKRVCLSMHCPLAFSLINRNESLTIMIDRIVRNDVDDQCKDDDTQERVRTKTGTKLIRMKEKERERRKEKQEGRNDRRKEGRNDRSKVRQKDRLKERKAGRQKDGRKERRRERRKERKRKK